MFSPVVTDHWLGGVPVSDAGPGIRIVVDPTLASDRSLSLLHVDGGPSVLLLTPERADELSLSGAAAVDADALAQLLAHAGITLNDPDAVFALTLDTQQALRTGAPTPHSRQLSNDDADLFARLASEAPEDDWDEAFVELDHWLVAGTFMDGRLVAVASMYPWADSLLADTGVFTHPEFRGRGLAATTVRTISVLALERGYQPQYRCQLDNAASLGAAARAGFTRFGTWEVID